MCWRILSVSMWMMTVWDHCWVIPDSASSDELESLVKQNADYSNDAIVGKAGIEQYMELELQGKDGQETVTVDNLGKVLED